MDWGNFGGDLAGGEENNMIINAIHRAFLPLVRKFVEVETGKGADTLERGPN